MVEQIDPEEYFKESDKRKKKQEKEKEEKAKQAEQENQKAQMIFKPGEKPMIIRMPPVKVVINLDKCPHCGLSADAHAEIDTEKEGGKE